ncbi:MAG TPA: nuclear transport factor 2 family protein [Terriglobales bacterium]|nr:nuclear transport factor 2 family protein [Terriglobales bacterium]
MSFPNSAFVFLLYLFVSVIPMLAADSSADDANIQMVRDLSAQETDAFVRNDPEKLASLWSEDFMVTNPLNKLVSKREVLAMIRSGFLVIIDYSRSVEYAHAYDDMVILAGSEQVRWGGRMPKSRQRQTLRFTAVWKKQQGRWQEIARHANILPE